MILRLVCVIFILNSIKSLNAKGMFEIFKWKQMDFYEGGNQPETDSYSPDRIYYPGEPMPTRRRTSNNTPYIAKNNVPMGVTHFGGRLYVTIPRRGYGIPSTLNYITLSDVGYEISPKLRAYPDFETNQLTSKLPHLVSVYRTRTDEIGRLWFIDTGMLEYPNNFTQVQRPSIWVIDLKNDAVLRRFEIPESVVAEGRGLGSITIDVDLESMQTFAYVPDLLNNRLYVYSFQENKMWSFAHNYFYFDPLAGDLNIGGQSFRWNSGIVSACKGPKRDDGSRLIYFHPLASNNEFIVNNRVLQNETNAHYNYKDFRLLGSRGPQKQSTMHEYDPGTGVIFYAEIQENGVGCWNTKKLFNAENHGRVAHNEDTMIYPSDLTIDAYGIIWVMTNSLPNSMYSTLDTDQYNFRVWKQYAREAIKETVCA